MTTSPPRPRPYWARRLDRWTLRVARVLSPLFGRPSDELLTRLARVARPSPPIVVPSAADLGIIDHLDEGRRALSGGLYAEALFHFRERLTQTDETDSWAWHGRGDALQLLKQPDDALAAYDRAVALQPNQGLHHMGRANALESVGRGNEADAATRQALSLDASLTWMRPHP